MLRSIRNKIPIIVEIIPTIKFAMSYVEKRGRLNLRLMNIDETILKIIQLPETFKIVRNRSMYSLLQETGYFESHGEINNSGIFNVLSSHPEYIEDWITWSEDKRTDSGWYIEAVDNSRCIVGYFPETKQKKSKPYSNLATGCAAFIKLEIEEIRNLDTVK